MLDKIKTKSVVKMVSAGLASAGPIIFALGAVSVKMSSA